MGITEPNSTTKDLISVRQMIKELQGEVKALTYKLKAAMVAQGTEVLLGGRLESLVEERQPQSV